MKKKLILLFLIFFFAFSPWIMHKTARKIERIRQKLCTHNHGYLQDKHPKHFFDRELARAILEFLIEEKTQSLVDFGCGANGFYVKFFLENNLYCEGFDGNPYSPKISKGLVNVLDLSEPFDLEKKYDWAISLQVAECIPKEFEKTLLENLNKHSLKGIILSWTGEKNGSQINLRSSDYVKKIFLKMGYENDLKAEEKLKKNAKNCFKNSLMVFRKKEKSLL